MTAHCSSSGIEMAKSAPHKGSSWPGAARPRMEGGSPRPDLSRSPEVVRWKDMLEQGRDASRLSDRGKRLLVLLIKKYGWKAITIALGALVGLATQRLIEMPWKRLRGSSPPKVLADRRSPWGDAVSWAIASGVGVGVARLVAIRAAAGVWEAAVHEPPPEPGLAVSTAA